MASRGVSVLKFVGTVSLGLLTVSRSRTVPRHDAAARWAKLWKLGRGDQPPGLQTPQHVEPKDAPFLHTQNLLAETNTAVLPGPLLHPLDPHRPDPPHPPLGQHGRKGFPHPRLHRQAPSRLRRLAIRRRLRPRLPALPATRPPPVPTLHVAPRLHLARRRLGPLRAIPVHRARSRPALIDSGIAARGRPQGAQRPREDGS